MRADPASLEITRFLGLAWHDGPEEGFLEFAAPKSVWHFELLALRALEDAVDDRLFVLRPAPDDAFSTIDESLRVIGVSAETRWYPGSDAEITVVERVVESVMRQLGERTLIVRSPDLVRITEVWLAVPNR